MRSVCAWCKKDGAPAYLGERGSLEDSGTTHGICSRHFMQFRSVLRPVSRVTQGASQETHGAPKAPFDGER
jgi:hypothetical protein